MPKYTRPTTPQPGSPTKYTRPTVAQGGTKYTRPTVEQGGTKYTNPSVTQPGGTVKYTNSSAMKRTAGTPMPARKKPIK